VKCYPWTHKDKIALVGDSSHAIVPFMEGMNSGFEDISILNEMMENMVMIGR
jgi:kynurenine 3-monooxygenase